MPELDPDDVNCPLFHEVRAMFAPKFVASPWAPQYLEIPVPATLTGQIDMLQRNRAIKGDTQVMEVIGDVPGQ